MNVTQQHKVWQNLHIACTRRESRATKATTNDCIAAKRGFRGGDKRELGIKNDAHKKKREREREKARQNNEKFLGKQKYNKFTNPYGGRPYGSAYGSTRWKEGRNTHKTK